MPKLLASTLKILGIFEDEKGLYLTNFDNKKAEDVRHCYIAFSG